MERALKERIIGAVVLVAAAVLLVPVFLDGSTDDTNIVSERITLPGQSKDGIRTVVLDRDRSEPVPSSTATQERSEPGQSEPVQSDAARPEPPASEPESPAAEPAATQTAETQPAPATNDEPALPQAAEPEASAPAASETAPQPSRSGTGMYAVQLGSFSNQANAKRLAAELRQQGFAAFLSKLDTANGELHRVRIGPQRDRQSAETMAARLERAGQTGQVVPHP